MTRVLCGMIVTAIAVLLMLFSCMKEIESGSALKGYSYCI